MISEQDALAAILRQVEPLPAMSLPLSAARGRFAAGNLFATLPLPIFENSSMDGYAVASQGLREGVRLRVAGEQAAGLDRGLRLSAGEAIRIFTGAPIPAGADAVVMQEDVSAEGGEIILRSVVEAGENIRSRGCDLAQGQKIVQKGARLTPQSLGLLAAQGLGKIAVGGSLQAGIISTGDELARPGDSLARGQIYESNSVLMRALAESAGAEVAMVEQASDEPRAMRELIERGLEFPVLILTGGVSVGERDFVKPVLHALSVATEFWRVAIKPGKPFLFGRRAGSLVFGLPGNPISAFVTFLLFVRPALLRLMGAADCELPLPAFPARTSMKLSNTGERPHYLRGLLREGGFAPTGRQESHALYGLSQANALVRLRPGQMVQAGEMVEALVWG